MLILPSLYKLRPFLRRYQRVGACPLELVNLRVPVPVGSISCELITRRAMPKASAGETPALTKLDAEAKLVAGKSERHVKARKVVSMRFTPAALSAPLLTERASDLFSFMKRRDELRRNKEEGLAAPWSNDAILAEYKFTNVKREHDRTTRWMREHFTGVHASTSSAGITVFNCALFRIFGTVELATMAGWTHAYDAYALERIAHTCRAEHGHAFTSAYCLPLHNAEVNSVASAQRAYERVCRKYLQAAWDRRDILGAACASGSWRELTEALRATLGFGGSGFMAKEVALDVMQTKHLRQACDRNEWCPVGPGARRGLNRLHGRPAALAIGASGGACERRFLDELRALYDAILAAESAWCQELDIELHDLQFQLCEYDKYQRICLREGGRKTKYVPYAPSSVKARGRSTQDT